PWTGTSPSSTSGRRPESGWRTSGTSRSHGLWRACRSSSPAPWPVSHAIRRRKRFSLAVARRRGRCRRRPRSSWSATIPDPRPTKRPISAYRYSTKTDSGSCSNKAPRPLALSWRNPGQKPDRIVRSRRRCRFLVLHAAAEEDCRGGEEAQRADEGADARDGGIECRAVLQDERTGCGHTECDRSEHVEPHALPVL